MQIKVNDNEFQLFVGEKRILEHSKERPMIYVGVGQEDVDMYRGNFKITDYVTERFPLKLTDVIQTADTVRLLLCTKDWKSRSQFLFYPILLLSTAYYYS